MRHDVHTAPLTLTVQKRKTHRFSICFTLLLFLGMALTAHGGGGDVNSPWPVVNQVADKQNAAASAVDSLGNVIVTGFHNVGTSYSYHTVRFNADGSVAWAAEPVAGHAVAVVVDGDDNIIVTGFVTNGTNKDILTVKYCNNPDPAKCDTKVPGEKIWEHTFNGAAGGNDAGASIAVDSDRNVYVAGYSNNSSGNDDYIILKYDPLPESGTTGKLLWPVPAAYSGPANNADHALAIAAGTSGVAVTGYSENAATTDIETVKFGPAGNQLWAKRYTATGSSAGKYVKMDGSGNVIVAGSATNGSATDIYIVKYAAADGEMIWEKAPDTTPGVTTVPYGLTLDTAYDVYVLGGALTIAGSNDIFTAKYKGVSDTGTTATPAWPQAQIFNSDNGNDDLPAGIAVDAGGVYVTGFSAISDHSDILTLKYTKDTGVLLWHKVNSIVEGKDARSVGINLSLLTGEVLVGGWTDTAGYGYDYFVIKYDQGVLNGPTSLTAVATSQTSLDLTWQDNSEDENGFELKRCTDQAMTTDCTTIPVAPHTGTGTVTHSDTGLTKNTCYYYQVLAYKNGSPTLYSNYSDLVQALTVFVAPADPAWSYTYNGPAGFDDYAVAIKTGPDNNPVATGTRTGSGSGFDYYTVKLDRTDNPALREIWANSYDDDNSLENEATCVAVGGDGSVTVSGNSMLYNGETGSVNSLYTLGYSQGGAPTALHDQYNGPITGGAVNDKAVASAVDAANNVVVVGNGLNAPAPGGNNDIYLIKYDAAGNMLWEAIPFDGAEHGNDLPTAVALRADGSIFISGYTGKAAPNAGKANFFAAKYSATGVKIWSYEYSVKADGDNKASSLAVDANGDPYVTGYITNADGNKDFYTVKFDGASNSDTPVIKWSQPYGDSFHGDDQAAAVMIDRANDADPVSGNIVVVGTTLSGTGDHDITILRYDQAGNRNWAHTLKRPAYDDYAKALGLDSQGNIFVATNSSKSGITHSLGLKYDYQGNYLGATGYDIDPGSLLSDEAKAIAVNSLNEAFVAGFKKNAGAVKDFLVYKIAAEISPALMPYTFTVSPLHTSVILYWQDNTAGKNGFNIQKQAGACSFASNSNTWIDLPTQGAAATNFTDSGLTPGSTFCYRIQTTLSSGAKSRWNYLTATTPVPQAPTNLTGTAANTTQVNCTWDDSTIGRSGFRLFRCEGASCSQVGGDLPASPWSYSDASACPSTEYTYKIKAFGPGWETPFSDLSPPAITPTPDAPAGLTASRVSEWQINLSWTKNTSDGGFKIQRCAYAAPDTTCSFPTNPGDPDYIYDTVGNVSTYNDTNKGANLAPDTTYRYQVKAYKTAPQSCNGGWETSYSNVAQAATTFDEPARPVCTAVDTTRVNCNWTKNTAGESGFRLFRCDGAGENCAQAGGDLPATPTSYSDTSACPLTPYTYKALAFGSGWTTPFSPLSTPVTTGAVPGAPNLQSATRVSEVAIDLNWQYTAADETGFNIERCSYVAPDTTCTPAPYDTVDKALRSYRDTNKGANLVPRTTYRYQIKAYKTAPLSCGSGWTTSPSGYKEATTSFTPTVLSLDSALINTTRIGLNWTDTLASKTGFNIYRCTGSTCNPVSSPDPGFPVSRGAAVFSYQDTTVSNGITYRYQVQATGSPVPPWPNDPSNTVQATATTAAPPVLTASRNSEAEISLTWSDPNPDETGSELWRCEKVDTSSCTLQYYRDLGPYTTASRSYLDSGLPADKTYTYQIQSYKNATPGAWRKESNTADAATTLLSPANLNCTADATPQVTCNWEDKTATETAFKIDRCTEPNCPTSDPGWPVSKGAGVITHLDTAVCKGQVYRYKVWAEKTTAPAWVSGTSNTFEPPMPSYVAPVAPTNLTAYRDSEVQIHLNWTKFPPNGTGFKIERCSYVEQTAPCTNFTEYDTVGDVTAYTDTNKGAKLSVNTNYRYQVKGYKTSAQPCEAWETGYTNIAEAATTVIKPSNPTIAVSTVNVCNDLRFLDSDGNSSLTYWVEPASCNTANTKVWLKFSSLPAGNRQISLYYANPPASPMSNGNNVFEFFDDFDGSSIDTNKWNISDGTGFSVSGGYLHGTNVQGKLNSTALFSSGTILEIKARTTVANANGQVAGGLYKAYSNSIGWFTNSYDTRYTVDYNDFSKGSQTPANNMMYTIKVKDAATVNMQIYNLDTSSLFWDVGDVAKGVSGASIALGRPYDRYYDLSNPSYATDWDFIRVRKYAAPEPAFTMGAMQFGSYSLTGGTWGAKRPITVANGGSALTDYQVAVTLDTTALASGQIRVEWDINTVSETGFVIERCTGDNCDFSSKSTFTVGAGINNYVDQAFSTLVANCYHVKAVRTGYWESEFSDKVCAPASIPPPPASLRVTSTSEASISLEWDDTTTGESAFILERCKDDSCTFQPTDDGYMTTTLEANIKTFTDTTVCGGPYKYRVKAFKAGAYGWTTEPGNVISVSTLTPDAPSDLRATRVSESRIYLEWTNRSTDQDKLVVARCVTGAGCSFSQTGPDLSKDANSFNDDFALTLNTGYTYRVKAVKGGTCSWETMSGTADAQTTLLAPTLTATAINATQIDLAWNDATGSETNFELLRCKDAGCSNFDRIAPLLPANTLKYSDTAVLPSTTYAYKLRAVNEGLSYSGGSAWTKKVKLSIADFQPDYQTKMVVSLAAVNGMKSDFSDMRFFDADTGHELPYWIESKSASSATVWFRTGQTNNIYLYYGNPAAISSSNITNTFIFGDDFSGDTSKWDLGGAQIPNMTLENGQAHLTGTPPACHQVWDDYSGGWYQQCDSVNYFAATKDSITMSAGLQVDVDLQLNTGTYAYYFSQNLVGLATSPSISKSFQYSVCNPLDEYDCHYVHGVSLLTYGCYDDGYGGTYCGYGTSATAKGTVGPAPANTMQPTSITITPAFTIGTYMGDPARIDAALPSDYQFKLKFNLQHSQSGITIANVKVRRYAPLEPTVTLQSTETVAPGFANTWSTESAPDSDTTPALPVPGELTCRADNTTQVYCHWLDTTSAETGFKIERCKVEAGGCDFSVLDQGFPVVVGANQQEYTDTTVSHSTAYKYRVYATRNIDPPWNSGYSNEAPVTSGVAAAPAPFQVVAVSASVIDLVWTKKTTDETGYRIERCAAAFPVTTCDNFSPLPDILPQGAASFNNTGLAPSTDYCYRVRVFKTATPGGWDLPSGSLCDRTFPGAPANFVAVPLNSFTIQLNWEDISPDEDGYKIEKQTWNEKWVPYVTLPADKTTFIDTLGNEPMKKYKYRMKIFREGDESIYSEATATTPGYTQNDGTCR